MWPWGCIGAPITPNGPTGRPSRVRKAGMMVWNGRLPGAYSFGWPSSRVNPSPRLWRAMPVPGTTMPLPNPW